ncbi:MAG: gas vesicle protein GvpO [Bacillota bacterium]
MMKPSETIRKVQEEFTLITKLPVHGIVGLSRDDGTWVVSLEALERRAIPDTMDILGLYEVRMSDDGELQGLERKKLRKRGETKEEH